MCEPTSIIIGMTVAGAAIKGIQAVADHVGQQQQHDDNEVAAKADLKTTYGDLLARAGQERAATAQSIMATDRQARQAQATAAVSAGESGVAGASVDALLQGIDRDRAQANLIGERNLDFTLGQIRREATGARAQALDRINSVPAPNPWLTGLRILGAGAEATAGVAGRLPSTGGR